MTHPRERWPTQIRTGDVMTPKLMTFLTTYVACGSAAAAYRETYGLGLTLTAAQAASRAYSLLRKPVCKAYLDEVFERSRELAGITRRKVIERAAQLAFADARQAYDQDGTPLRPHELPDEVAPAVVGYRRDQGGTSVKLVDPVAAIRTLGDLMGMRQVTVDHNAQPAGQFVVLLED